MLAKKTHRLAQNRIFSKRQLVIVVTGLVAIGIYLIFRTRAAGVYAVPLSIPADCSRNVETDLMNFFATVPDGSEVDFPTGGCYAIQSRIEIRQRQNLIVDGHDSTFKSSTPNDNNDNQPVWYLFKVHGMTLRNATLIGNFHDRGQPNIDRGAVASNAGVGVFGGRDIHLDNLKISDVFGDGVEVARSWFENTFEPETPYNVHVTHITVNTAGRHCVSPDQVDGFWLEDSNLTRCFLDGVDAERDLAEDPLRNVHFLRNTFSDNFGDGIVIPIGGIAQSPSDTIEIRGNKFPTLNFASVCNQQITLGAYPGQTHSNVVIEDNEMVAWTEGIIVENVISGSIKNNKITRDPKALDNDCGGGGHNNPVGLVNSPNVEVSNNGPNAAGPNPSTAQPSADLNHDGRVDGADLSTVLRLYGTTDTSGDTNGDGQVNGQDLSTVLRLYGQNAYQAQ